MRKQKVFVIRRAREREKEKPKACLHALCLRDDMIIMYFCQGVRQKR